MAFDHYMLHVEAGHNGKTCRLTDAERCAWFLGVIPLAAKSPVRGALLIGSLSVDAGDIARQAAVTLRTAKSTLKRASELGLLERDDNGILWVHDFNEHNPEPRKDTTAAERKRRQRQREREKAAEVTAVSRCDRRDDVTPVTPPEVEVEEKEKRKTPPSPPEGGTADSAHDLRGSVLPQRPTSGRRRDELAYEALLAEWKRVHVDVLTVNDGEVIDEAAFGWIIERFLGDDEPATAENLVVGWYRWFPSSKPVAA